MFFVLHLEILSRKWYMAGLIYCVNSSYCLEATDNCVTRWTRQERFATNGELAGAPETPPPWMGVCCRGTCHRGRPPQLREDSRGGSASDAGPRTNTMWRDPTGASHLLPNLRGIKCRCCLRCVFINLRTKKYIYNYTFTSHAKQ